MYSGQVQEIGLERVTKRHLYIMDDMYLENA